MAGVGDGLTAGLVRHSQRKRGATDRLSLRSTAPALDPTDCATCKRFVRYAPQHQCRFESADIPHKPMRLDGCQWLGFVRQQGHDWLLVVWAGSISGAWDALLTCHLEGDRLVVPTVPREWQKRPMKN